MQEAQITIDQLAEFMTRREQDAENEHAVINELQMKIIDAEKLQDTIDDKNKELYLMKLKHDTEISENERKLSSLERELVSRQNNIDVLNVRTKDLEKIYEMLSKCC